MQLKVKRTKKLVLVNKKKGKQVSRKDLGSLSMPALAMQHKIKSPDNPLAELLIPSDGNKLKKINKLLQKNEVKLVESRASRTDIEVLNEVLKIIIHYFCTEKKLSVNYENTKDTRAYKISHWIVKQTDNRNSNICKVLREKGLMNLVEKPRGERWWRDRITSLRKNARKK
jgi:hypothetical protein